MKEQDELSLFVCCKREKLLSYLFDVEESETVLKTKHVMLEIKRPVKILEIGTAVGFSAILMGKYSPEECHITTIENYEKRIPIARANFARAGMEQKITLLEGDALEIMKGMPDDAGFDFVFMDAAKGQYPAYLEQVMRFKAEVPWKHSFNDLVNAWVWTFSPCPERIFSHLASRSALGDSTEVKQ